MNFYIQASNPRAINPSFFEECLSAAIESTFPMNTESAILFWNHIAIPLSYKYDISYMIDDLLMILQALEQTDSGHLNVQWLPDTFRCNWSISWNTGIVDINAEWECVMGHLEELLKRNNSIVLPLESFVNEWRGVLHNVIIGLENAGYNENSLYGMGKLIKQYNRIWGQGILYEKLIKG